MVTNQGIEITNTRVRREVSVCDPHAGETCCPALKGLNAAQDRPKRKFALTAATVSPPFALCSLVPCCARSSFGEHKGSIRFPCDSRRPTQDEADKGRQRSFNHGIYEQRTFYCQGIGSAQVFGFAGWYRFSIVQP